VQGQVQTPVPPKTNNNKNTQTYMAINNPVAEIITAIYQSKKTIENVHASNERDGKETMKLIQSHTGRF
jgi:hypothetical protein